MRLYMKKPIMDPLKPADITTLLAVITFVRLPWRRLSPKSVMCQLAFIVAA